MSRGKQNKTSRNTGGSVCLSLCLPLGVHHMRESVCAGTPHTRVCVSHKRVCVSHKRVCVSHKRVRVCHKKVNIFLAPPHERECVPLGAPHEGVCVCVCVCVVCASLSAPHSLVCVPLGAPHSLVCVPLVAPHQSAQPIMPNPIRHAQKKGLWNSIIDSCSSE